MKKFILLLITLFTVQFLFAQSPQGFNYQAQIRDSEGEVISEQNVSLKINILQSSTSGEVVYSEEHQVQTNSNGLVNLTIGDGELISGGFSSIPWDNGPFYVQLEMDMGDGYTKLGTTKLLSVPYALYSEKTENVTNYGSDTLFVVKDKQGNVVFAVFPNGAKLYVGSSDTKGQGGGFAVSGRVAGKKGEFPIFNTTADSTRIFVDGESSNKEQGGGFAVSGRTANKGESNDILVSSFDSTRIYVDNSSKEQGGGFAVSGRTANKARTDQFLDLTPENYFIGHQSGNSNEGGIQNVFLGYNAGYSNVDGGNNIFLGYKAGYHNVGYREDVEGSNNIFIGTRAGFNNLGANYQDYGMDNVFIGKDAGYSNKNGPKNVFIGNEAGYNNIGENSGNGGYNVFIGNRAGKGNLTGSQSVLIGTKAGLEIESGLHNVIIGDRAGAKSAGSSNLFLGKSAGYYINGSGNVFLGSHAGNGNSDTTLNVEDNTFVGETAGGSFRTGTENVLLGKDAGYYLDSAANNVFLGSEAGKGYGTAFCPGSRNVFIGYQAGYNETASDRLYIENSDANSSDALVYGEFDNDLLQVNGRLGVGVSPASEQLEIGGAIKIGDASGADEGVIRWTGSDFEGRKNSSWVTLTNKGDGHSLDADGGSYEDVVYVDNTGNLGLGLSSPLTKMHVQDEVNGYTSSNIDSHVAIFENTLSTSKRAPVLALKIGTTEAPGIYSNYLTFFDGNDNAVGSIQGNGSGGIELNSGSADFSEYLPKLNNSENFQPYEVVGIIGGKVSKRTDEAEQISVVTNQSIIAGNNPGREQLENFTKVSLMGQVPVKVKGKVNEGDYILPSGNNDGIAVGKSIEELTENALDKIVGIAWDTKKTMDIGKVRTYISLNNDKNAILSLMKRNNQLKRKVDKLEGRLKEIEKRLDQIEN